MVKEVVGIYPGTFDPITIGHIDIIERCLPLVDKLIVSVAADTNKTPLFSLKKRGEMVEHEVENLNKKYKSKGKIIVKTFNGLLIDFAAKNEATIIIRGLRAVSDFEYEFQMSCVNSRLNPDIETVFIPASENTQFISSRFVREVSRLGGDVSAFVSENVQKQLKKAF